MTYGTHTDGVQSGNLTKVEKRKEILTPPKKQILFAQGEATDAVFYIQAGKVQVTVVSKQGKEAVVAILK